MGMPRRTLSGKRVLITGASDGIGQQLALAAARAGCRVLGIARSETGLESLANEAKSQSLNLFTLRGDVTKPPDRENMLAMVRERFGGLDILVNNAGIGTTNLFQDDSPESLRTVMETNLFAVAEMIRMFIPELQQGEQPLIVNVSCILGRRGVPTQSAYCASKFAVQGLSDAIRAELCKVNIGVLVVNPGLTNTAFAKHQVAQAKTPFQHSSGMAPVQVARKILEAIEADKAEITLTAQGKLLVLMNRLFPRFMDWVLRRQVQ